MSTTTSKILSNISLEILRARGNDTTLSNRTRKISNTSYCSRESLDSQVTVEIPKCLQSLETIHFMEFTGTTAEVIYSDYLANRKMYPDRANVFKQATALVSLRYDRKGMQNSSNWVQNMIELGLSSNFRARMMDPEYEDLRRSRSLKEWVIEMLNARYEFLQTLDSVIKAPEHLILGRKSSRLGLDGNLHTKLDPEVSPCTSSDREPMTGHFTPQEKAIALAIEAPSTALPEHTTLWKIGARHRLDTLIQSDGTLRFINLLSDASGDFSSFSYGLYFTKHEDVAWKYAQWAAKLFDGNVIPVGFLRVSIPNHLLRSQKELSGDESRKLVFANRRRELPPSALAYLSEYQWLVGPICHNSSEQTLAMKDPSELTMLKFQESGGNGSQTASQHWTGQMSMVGLLDHACVGKVWISDMEGRLAKKKGN